MFSQDYLHIVDSLNIPTPDSQYLLDLIKHRHWGESVLIVDVWVSSVNVNTWSLNKIFISSVVRSVLTFFLFSELKRFLKTSYRQQQVWRQWISFQPLVSWHWRLTWSLSFKQSCSITSGLICGKCETIDNRKEFLCFSSLLQTFLLSFCSGLWLISSRIKQESGSNFEHSYIHFFLHSRIWYIL